MSFHGSGPRSAPRRYKAMDIPLTLSLVPRRPDWTGPGHGSRSMRDAGRIFIPGTRMK